MGSLVDPSYELLDPTPDIHALFVQFDGRFFDGRLAACEVKWSARMTTCAGICSYEGGRGLCSIRLSKPLLTLRPRKDLIETLLHEMIHAFLFVTVRDRDRDGHGEQFQWHMRRINKEAKTNITIYHTFHAEVANYKTHHWRCSGSCRERRPFFGWVKRTTNRAPSKNDLWWAAHEQICGGKFVKVAEPKEFTEKQKRKDEIAAMKKEGGVTKKVGGVAKKEGGVNKKEGGVTKKSPKTDDPKQPKIDAAFRGGGAKLGGEAGVSRLLTDDKQKESVNGGGGQALGGGPGSSRLLDLFGTAEKSKDTVAGRENYRSTIDDYDDDEIQVIEPAPTVGRQRGGLKGGARDALEEDGGILRKNSKSKEEPDEEVVVDEEEEEQQEQHQEDDGFEEDEFDYEDEDVADRGQCYMGEGYDQSTTHQQEFVLDDDWAGRVVDEDMREEEEEDEPPPMTFGGREGEDPYVEQISVLEAIEASLTTEITRCCDNKSNEDMCDLFVQLEAVQTKLKCAKTAQEVYNQITKGRKKAEEAEFEMSMEAISDGEPPPVLSEGEVDVSHTAESQEKWRKKRELRKKILTERKEKEEKKKEKGMELEEEEEEEYDDDDDYEEKKINRRQPEFDSDDEAGIIRQRPVDANDFDSEEEEQGQEEEESEEGEVELEDVGVVRRIPEPLNMTFAEFMKRPAPTGPPKPPRYQLILTHKRKVPVVEKQWRKEAGLEDEDDEKTMKEEEQPAENEPKSGTMTGAKAGAITGAKRGAKTGTDAPAAAKKKMVAEPQWSARSVESDEDRYFFEDVEEAAERMKKKKEEQSDGVVIKQEADGTKEIPSGQGVPAAGPKANMGNAAAAAAAKTTDEMEAAAALASLAACAAPTEKKENAAARAAVAAPKKKKAESPLKMESKEDQSVAAPEPKEKKKAGAAAAAAAGKKKKTLVVARPKMTDKSESASDVTTVVEAMKDVTMESVDVKEEPKSPQKGNQCVAAPALKEKKKLGAAAAAAVKKKKPLVTMVVARPRTTDNSDDAVVERKMAGADREDVDVERVEEEEEEEDMDATRPCFEEAAAVDVVDEGYANVDEVKEETAEEDAGKEKKETETGPAEEQTDTTAEAAKEEEIAAVAAAAAAAAAAKERPMQPKQMNEEEPRDGNVEDEGGAKRDELPEKREKTINVTGGDKKEKEESGVMKEKEEEEDEAAMDKTEKVAGTRKRQPRVDLKEESGEKTKRSRVEGEGEEDEKEKEEGETMEMEEVKAGEPSEMEKTMKVGGEEGNEENAPGIALPKSLSAAVHKTRQPPLTPQKGAN